MAIQNSFISAGNVATDAAQAVNDMEFGRLGKPFYMSAIQRAVEELCFDANWDTRRMDVAMPENLIQKLPDTIGLVNIYAYSGDNCDIGHSKTVYIAENLWHKGGSGYLKNNKFSSSNDGLQWNGIAGWPSLAAQYTLFAGHHDGHLYLSGGCASYERLHIEYLGAGYECWGDDVKVPRWARTAVTDYVIHLAAEAREGDDPRFYGNLIARKANQLNVNNSAGSWFRAMGRYTSMDPKERRDTELIISRTAHSFL